MSLTRSFPLVTCSVLLAAALFVPVAGQQPDAPDAVGNQVLVQFTASSTAAERAAASVRRERKSWWRQPAAATARATSNCCACRQG